MKRADIELGVEYCATAPLAFGKEPRDATPQRIRFTSKQPGRWRCVHYQEVREYKTNTGRIGRRWETVRTEVHLEDQAPERTNPGPTTSLPIGSGRVQWALLPGGLPCERWHRVEERWIPWVEAPAAVHRTWAEYQAAVDARAEASRQRDADTGVDRLQAWLREFGLDRLGFTARSGYGTRVVIATTGTGQELLAQLNEWATFSGLRPVAADEPAMLH